eukprot:PhF_6_TR22208/c0_g1_i1/m.31354/K01620/ltaE; threonine aldolase
MSTTARGAQLSAFIDRQGFRSKTPPQSASPVLGPITSTTQTNTTNNNRTAIGKKKKKSESPAPPSNQNSIAQKRDRSNSPTPDTLNRGEYEEQSLYHTKPLTFRCPVKPNNPVDLRSDTFTLPPPEMRLAMAEAPVGDDVWEEDPTVKRLEDECAQLFGKEAALFVLSGTQGNLMCLMDHCRTIPSEYIAGDLSHTVLYEGGGVGVLAHAHCFQVPTNDDGTLPLDIVESRIRGTDVHYPITRCLSLENTHNMRGGKVLPMNYIWQAKELCKRKNIALHCDAARIWNAAAALNVSLSTVAEPFDTLSVCLSKGMGCPVGGVVLGSKEFVKRARHLRKILGGGLRQAGILAASGLYAIQHMFPRMVDDHANALELEQALLALGYTVRKVQSNIVIFNVGINKQEAFLQKTKERGVLMLKAVEPGSVRAITHCGVSRSDMTKAIAIINQVAKSI